MDSLAPEQYRALLRQYFCAFIQRSFRHLNPQTSMQMNWHIEVIAAKLEACRRGEIRRLIINVPPRHLKSICASVAFPAWVLGLDPTAQILCVSYAQDLADKLARDCRSLITSAWYKATFPTRLSTEKQAVQEFVTNRQGFRMATSVGGVLTGRGADIIVIDDPLKPDEALSDSRRQSANEWYDNTLYSRLNSKERGCIILIMQRLHEDDLVGHVLAQEKWEVLSFPAIADRDEEHVVETALGTRRFVRREGELLHPQRESRDVLDGIRKTVGEYNFAGQYLQAPAPPGGGMVKEEWFKSYGPTEKPQSFDRIVQSWDTANKASEVSDYSVCTTWGMKGKDIYLLDVLRRRMTYPDLKRTVLQQARLYSSKFILIEDSASGTQLIQELGRDGLSGLKARKADRDKVIRLSTQTSLIESGFVYLPREAGWRADYLREITIFPNCKFDDQVDSTSQALAFINELRSEPSVLVFTRRQALKRFQAQRMSVEEIANEMNKTLEEIQEWIDEMRDPTKPRQAKAVVKSPLSTPPETPTPPQQRWNPWMGVPLKQ